MADIVQLAVEASQLVDSLNEVVLGQSAREEVVAKVAKLLFTHERRIWLEASKLGWEQSPHHLECALKWARQCEERANAA